MYLSIEYKHFLSSPNSEFVFLPNPSLFCTGVLLTGFLGSGKTTLLNRILKDTDKKLAIIENEVGAVSVDDKLIFRRGDKDGGDVSIEYALLAIKSAMVCSYLPLSTPPFQTRETVFFNLGMKKRRRLFFCQMVHQSSAADVC
jgi:hypothetical protein